MPGPYESLPPRTGAGLINIVIDTPKGSRNKFKYDESAQCFRLSRVLPAGTSFPFDFGSIPKTVAEDGDPLDVLLLSDAPSFPGCLVTGKLIGTICAEQAEQNKTIRNDRLLAVPVTSANPAIFSSLEDLPETWLTEIEHFFISYNQIQGRKFNPFGRGGPDEADKTLLAAEQRFFRQASR